jgi:hypothetical protein
MVEGVPLVLPRRAIGEGNHTLVYTQIPLILNSDFGWLSVGRLQKLWQHPMCTVHLPLSPRPIPGTSLIHQLRGEGIWEWDMVFINMFCLMFLWLTCKMFEPRHVSWHQSQHHPQQHPNPSSTFGAWIHIPAKAMWQQQGEKDMGTSWFVLVSKLTWFSYIAAGLAVTPLTSRVTPSYYAIVCWATLR